MNEVFVCADPHFGHGNVIKYECRPFKDAEEMDERMISNWNNIVSKHDEVFILGDFALCGKEKIREIVSRLNGIKRLIMGNHDFGRSVKFWYEIGFDFVSPYPIVYKNEALLSHFPPSFLPVPFHAIFGHVHGSPDYPDHTKYASCVCMERINYKPVPLEDVISGWAFTN